jgi:hypothetical protein
MHAPGAQHTVYQTQAHNAHTLRPSGTPPKDVVRVLVVDGGGGDEAAHERAPHHLSTLHPIGIHVSADGVAGCKRSFKGWVGGRVGEWV